MKIIKQKLLELDALVDLDLASEVNKKDKKRLYKIKGQIQLSLKSLKDINCGPNRLLQTKIKL